MRRFTRLFSALALLVALVLAAMPVQAMEPVKTTIPETLTYIDPWVDCGTFTVREESLYRQTITRYFNNAGEIDRIRVDMHMLEGKLINNSDPSKQIVFGPSNYHWFLSPDFTQGRLLGLTQKVKLPGGGAVLITAGQWIWDDNTGMAVHHGNPENDPQVEAAVCEALR